MDFASANLTAGQLNAIVKKLGGEEGAMRFLRGELLVSTAVRTFPVWKTVKLGLHKTAGEYGKAVKSARRVSDWANDILGQPQFTCVAEETDADLVVLSVAELGFKDGSRYDAICARAKELGLDLCPAEVGPVLRLAYADQPYGEWLIIAMEAIAGSSGDRRVFAVEHGSGGFWLHGDNGRPGYFWRASRRFVFLRRK